MNPLIEKTGSGIAGRCWPRLAVGIGGIGCRVAAGRLAESPEAVAGALLVNSDLAELSSIRKRFHRLPDEAVPLRTVWLGTALEGIDRAAWGPSGDPGDLERDGLGARGAHWWFRDGRPAKLASVIFGDDQSGLFPGEVYWSAWRSVNLVRNAATEILGRGPQAPAGPTDLPVDVHCSTCGGTSVEATWISALAVQAAAESLGFRPNITVYAGDLNDELLHEHRRLPRDRNRLRALRFVAEATMWIRASGVGRFLLPEPDDRGAGLAAPGLLLDVVPRITAVEIFRLESVLDVRLDRTGSFAGPDADTGHAVLPGVPGLRFKAGPSGQPSRVERDLRACVAAVGEGGTPGFEPPFDLARGETELESWWYGGLDAYEPMAFVRECRLAPFTMPD